MRRMPISRQFAPAFEWLMALLSILVIPALVVKSRSPMGRGDG
jgi:hypothetical protein